MTKKALTKKQLEVLKDIINNNNKQVHSIEAYDDFGDDDRITTILIVRIDTGSIDNYRFHSDGSVDRRLSGGFGANNYYDILKGGD